ncbi:MAG: hypothetical protein ACLP4V_22270 [Methylocella sp.]
MRLEFVAESVVICLHVLDELTRHKLVEQLAQGQREALPGVFSQDGVRLLDAGECFGFEIAWYENLSHGPI